MTKRKGVKPVVGFTPHSGRLADKDMRTKALILTGNGSHNILYEVAYYAEIIYINGYSRYLNNANYCDL